MLFWREDHRHQAAFSLGLELDFRCFRKVFFHALQKSRTPIHMGHFAAPETDSHLDLVAAVKEAVHGFGLHLVIMRVDIGPHLDFFELLRFLTLTGGGFFLLILETNLSVIENFDNRHIGIWGDFYKVQTRSAGSGQGFVNGDFAAFFAGFCDE